MDYHFTLNIFVQRAQVHEIHVRVCELAACMRLHCGKCVYQDGYVWFHGR